MARARNAGILAVAITANSSAFDRTLSKTEQRINGFAKKTKNLSSGVAAGFAAVGVTMGASQIIGYGKEIVNSLDNIGKRSRALRISTDRYQMLEYAAKHTGRSMGTVEGAFMRLNTAMAKAAEGNKDMASAFRLAGLEVNSLKGKSPDQVFDEVAKALSTMEDQTRRDAVANQLFGRSYMELNGFLDDYLQLGDEAVKNGTIIPPEQIEASEKLNDQMDILNRQLVALVVSLGWIEKAAKLAADAVVAIPRIEWLKDIPRSIIDNVSVFGHGYKVTRYLGERTGLNNVLRDKLGFDPADNLTGSVDQLLGKSDLAHDEVSTAAEKAKFNAAAAARAAEKEASIRRKQLSDEEAARRLAAREAARKARAEKSVKTPKEKEFAAVSNGSFSLRDLARIVGGNSPAERTAKATEAIAKNSEEQTKLLDRLASDNEQYVGVGVYG